MGKRLNIGLFVTEFENEFTNDLCKGAIAGAKEIDANLYIFPGKYFDGVYSDEYRNRYEYQNNTVFTYASKENLDVLLVNMGMIGTQYNGMKQKAFFDLYRDLPIIGISSDVEGCPSVNFDNKIGIKAGIRHLINDCGCKKIGFISGPISNKDALDRLIAYKEGLLENHMEYTEELVEYGFFVEDSEPFVRTLLDNNSDIDGIIFANDQMATGGYKVFEERNIKVGKDIYVMGFDNAPCSRILEPNLTTVNADSAELGYRAVVDCEKLMKTNADSIYIDTKLIKRLSSSIKDEEIENILEKDGLDLCENVHIGLLLKTIDQYLFDPYVSKSATLEIKVAVNEYIMFLFTDVCGKTIDQLCELYINDYFDRFRQLQIEQYVDVDRFSRVFDYIHHKIKTSLEKERDKRIISDIISDFYKDIMVAKDKLSRARRTNIGELSRISAGFAGDILDFTGEEDDESYLSIVEKLSYLHIDSASIYLFNKPISHLENRVFQPPKTIYLKAYCKGEEFNVVSSQHQRVKVVDILDNEYTRNTNGSTRVVVPLFAREELFGIFVCELGYEYLYYITPLAYQICSTIKCMHLIKKKELIARQLSSSLAQIREKNVLLDLLSNTDELTGLYNRRGFAQIFNSIIYNEEWIGKKASIIYADMDNLKVINDRFGHEEGDIALKKVTSILQQAFNDQAIIARIGGDEFAILTLVTSGNFVKNIRENLKRITIRANERFNKPYYVSASIGIKTFVCKEKVDIQSFLTAADRDLYIQKKKRKKTI